jgi:GTP-binding protein Era
MAEAHRTGVVAIVGRPNAGKSTLLNTVLGQELSVVTQLPQTTRRNLRGIHTAPGVQIVFVDTPGIHEAGHRYNRAMTGESRAALRDTGVDAVAYVVDLGREFGDEEDVVAGLVAAAAQPRLVVFNKVDRCETPDARREQFRLRYPALAALPSVSISARRPQARESFLAALTPMLPEGPPLYPADDLTDENLRFFAAEFLRKAIIGNTREEVPHAACVEILDYKESPRQHVVQAVIHVETDGQRGILVGKGGTMIGRIRMAAEAALTRLAGAPVSYRLHVKVTPKWRDNPGFLRAMGYREV